MTTVIETCRIPPPQGVAAELFLPLSFFDMSYLDSNPMYVLNLYNHPCSEAEFSNTIVPNLKHSLSLTLQHYLPVAGNLLYPLHTDTDASKPVLRYISGDTVALTIAISSLDFNDLVANHAREADQFYDLVQPRAPLAEEENYKIAPVISLQATLFPGRGICIGVNFHHSLCDWRSIVGFVKAWAMVNKSGDDEALGESPPVFEKPDSEASRRVHGIFWNAMKKIPFKTVVPLPRPTNKVRASFILRQFDIKNLKHRFLSARPSLDRVSTFTVAAGYIWTTLVKSHGSSAEDKHEVFYFPADARGRQNALFDPPVPVNYFGNCLGGGLVKLEQRKLAGNDGFVVAAEAIGDVIKAKIYDGDEFLKRPEDRLGKIDESVVGVLAVYGSIKFECKEADFGWGVARKVEMLSLDREVLIGMLMSNSGDGGLVIDLSLPKERMESFASIFQDGLTVLEKIMDVIHKT
ncbi:malonyl-coenzyme:anthocyanin 5-O-glucoside-6'''-O-malonyltransferase-like [Salvia hispanica]|uniref:malonyl-coenzyme:anthocyanin 5-O-glucoside-6'''-O-malonyltransferase-like n=1 Tax=Salvia hispanica TaxID=49212 RepID=UPI0020094274|nr:malonyl-coenzyme:anthocyanin 5-O-glucoside-6'''-O-malonyltransferase-like [Salvia hispanica]